MNKTILIANAIALAASCIMVGSGLIRDKRRILLAQCAQFGLNAVSNLLLGGVSGSISNIIGIVRNLCSVRGDISLALKIAFCLFQSALTVMVSRGGALEILPVLATCVFTFALNTKSVVFLKGVIALGQAMWLVYDFSLKNYVAFAFDAFTICSVLVSIAAIKGWIKRGKGG